VSAHILVVEDEPDLAEALLFRLRREGYSAEAAGTGQQAQAAVARRRPDLVLLDLMLPDMSGLELCRALRASDVTKAVPIVMVTARADEIDRVVGFEVGADDYVCKPFSLRELVLRVSALLRRSAAPREAGTAMRFGLVQLDPEAFSVQIAEEHVTFTALEFRLLQVLLERRGRVQSRERLLEDVWGMSPEITTRTVDTHVKRLRRKLGPAADYIETLRGVGYRMRAEVPAGEPGAG
jgi:two-component system phosphate regulon response regulator PhoB